jgi:hypothetical protein
MMNPSPRQSGNGNAHPVTFKDSNQILVYAQSDENDRDRDAERQDKLETRCSVGLHEVFQGENDNDPRTPWAIMAL